MSFKSAAVGFSVLVAIALVGFGRIAIQLIVPDDFHGLIRVVQSPNGGTLALLYPRVIVPSSGIVPLQSVSRFFGWCRITAQRRPSRRTVPSQFSDEAARGGVCLWELPTTINPESCFFVGTATEYHALLQDTKFLQEYARDRRSERH